jgi:hypothetical protein
LTTSLYSKEAGGGGGQEKRPSFSKKKEKRIGNETEMNRVFHRLLSKLFLRRFTWYRKLIGGKWGHVTAMFFGKKWIRLPNESLLYDERHPTVTSTPAQQDKEAQSGGFDGY